MTKTKKTNPYGDNIFWEILNADRTEELAAAKAKAEAEAAKKKYEAEKELAEMRNFGKKIAKAQDKHWKCVTKR